MWKYRQGIEIGNTIYADLVSDKDVVYSYIAAKVTDICGTTYIAEGYYLNEAIVGSRRTFYRIEVGRIYQICGGTH